MVRRKNVRLFGSITSHGANCSMRGKQTTHNFPHTYCLFIRSDIYGLLYNHHTLSSIIYSPLVFSFIGRSFQHRHPHSSMNAAQRQSGECSQLSESRSRLVDVPKTVCLAMLGAVDGCSAVVVGWKFAAGWPWC